MHDQMSPQPELACRVYAANGTCQPVQRIPKLTEDERPIAYSFTSTAPPQKRI